MIALDTSFLIRALVPGTGEERTLRRWLARREALSMSAVAWAEFACGPLSTEDLALAESLLATRDPFTADDGARAATLFNATGRRRGSLVDCMIAAAAIRLDAPLATSNESDFRPFARHGMRLAHREG